MNNIKKIEITPKTIIITLLIIGVFLLLSKLKGILILVFISFIFASALSPVVESLAKRKIPRSISIFIIYILSVFFLLLLFFILVTPLFRQIQEFQVSIPEIISELIDKVLSYVPFLRDKINKQEIIDSFKSYLQDESLINFEFIKNNFEKAFGVVKSFFQSLVGLISFFVISYYFLTIGDRKNDFVLLFFPKDKREKMVTLIKNVELKMGAWARGQIFLCFIIGFFSWVILLLARAKFSLPLAVLSGIFEIMPGIGPTITWVIVTSFTIGSGGSLAQVLLVSIGFIVIQQLEGIFFVPKVMHKAVGIHPLIVILGIMIGGKLMGVGGALLAVPIIGISQIILEFYLEDKSKKKQQTDINQN